MVDAAVRRSRRGRAAVVFLALVCLVLGAIGGAFLGRRARGSESSAAPASAQQLWTCSMHPQVIQDHPGLCPICHMELTPLGAAPGTSGTVAIDPAVVQTMGVRTVRVMSGGNIGRRVRAFGALMEREPDHRDVNLRVTGWVETLYANVGGMNVARGDPLFTLSSPELVVAAQELVDARKQRDGGSMTSHGAGASKRPGAGDLTAQLFDAARSRMLLLGLDEKEVDRIAQLDAAPAVFTFQSPMDGHVVESTVYAGAAVKPGDRVMRIANNDKLWLDARVASRDIGRVAIGGSVRVRVDAYPGTEFTGQVLFVHPHVDMDTRTALVRTELDNPRMMLHEGMWASAEISSADEGEALVVPREAVIDTGERQLVFVALGEGRFEPREVVTGTDRDSGMLQIVSGLAVGEEVVVSGQFLLDSESRLREAVRKFLSSTAPGIPSPTGLPAQPGVTGQPDAATARPEWAEELDGVVASYLTVAEALGRPQDSDAPIDASAFVTASRQLASRAPADARVTAVADAAAALTGADLALQRERFKAASARLVELVTAVPPSEALGPQLFVMWCPMAPGNWLQRHEQVENPFYARTMKSCGEIQRRVPTLPRIAPEQGKSPR